MHDTPIELEHEPLDEGLLRSLERTSQAFSSLVAELLVFIKEAKDEPDAVNVLRWALMYAVVLRDLSRSSLLLLSDGGHSRAALILRRAAFEYRTRFRYFLMHPELASTAMHTFEKESKKFAERVGPNQVTFVYDPNIDEEQLKTAQKWKLDFKTICDEVCGEKADELYGHFYSYPSFLLHGSVLVSMDVLKSDGDPQGVYLTSARPFTNQIAGNLLVFLLEFAGDVVQTFDLQSRAHIDELVVEFNGARDRLGVVYV
jgi:hypothetical protein